MRIPVNMCNVLAVTLVIATIGWAQNQPTKQIKHVPITQTSPASGKEMYNSYCAVCHGLDGKGNGPAASALKSPVPDLTKMSAANGGKYPAAKVGAIIRGEQAVAAHGSKDMPIWGDLFWSISGGHQDEVQQRIANLNSYLETLQAK